MRTYLRATYLLDNPLIGVVCYWDETSDIVIWFNREGHYWHQNVKSTTAGFCCLEEFMAFYSFELCDRAEAFNLLYPHKQLNLPIQESVNEN